MQTKMIKPEVTLLSSWLVKGELSVTEATTDGCFFHTEPTTW